MWSVKHTLEYEDWFTRQDEENKMVINARVILLSEFGPNLGRPYVDTIKGSKIMEEEDEWCNKNDGIKDVSWVC